MARNSNLKWFLCFNWLTVLAIFPFPGHCSTSTNCTEIINSHTVFPFLESETVGYEIFNVSAYSLYIDDNDEYKDWLNVSKLSPDYWSVSLHKTFDTETASFVTVNFKCMETSNPPELNVPVMLQILDVNEYAPQFDNPDDTISIPESQEIGSIVYTIVSRDPDNPSSSIQIVYNITDGAYGYFEIQNTYRGNIQLVKELDYDAGLTSFVLNISAMELASDGNGLSNSTTLTINVTDVDDIMPEFLNAPYTLSLPEGQYAGNEWFVTTPVLSARDGDYHINQTIRFRISKGSQHSKLFSVAENGSIAAKGSLNSGTYIVLVEAYQTDKPALRYVTTPVTITVTDINDHGPELGQLEYLANVSEAVVPGTVILTVTADDEDVGINSVVEFHLGKAADGVFTVETDGHVGIIKLSKTLDRELRTNYTFEIWAEEILTKERKTSNRSHVVITVLDDNDNAPRFNQTNYTFNFSSAQHKGYRFGRISADDPDADENGQVKYAIQFSTRFDSVMAINSSTGDMTLTRDLGNSDAGSYDLTVGATDGATELTNRRSNFTQVTVNILPVNANSPMFTNSSYTFHVLETATQGSLVGKVTAVDDDGDKIKYVETGNLYGYFRVNTSNGEITVIKTPDLDNGVSPAPSDVSITVFATDGDLTTTTDVKIVVMHVNEFPPKFVSQGPVTVSDNKTGGAFIVQVNATDADAGPDGSVTFSLLPTTASNLFRINPNTGEITLNCSKCLDPSRGTYDLIIQAKDGGSPTFSDTMPLLVLVSKTIFAPPKFTQKFYHVNLLEDQSDQIILQLSATDSDTPLSQLTFSTTNQVFPQIAEHLPVIFPNGSVYINGTVDAEVFNYFTVGVSVSDGHSSDTAEVQVNIADKNEHSPVLNITSLGPVQIPEDANIKDFVAAIGATDADVTNAGFSYFLSKGADGKFVIDINTGIITVSGLLDRKLKLDYTITVNVLDHGLPPLLASGNLSVEVTDSNSAPYFTNDSTTVSDYEFYVQENLAVGDLIGALYATDPDVGSSGQFSFKLQPSVSSSYFSLDKDSGNLTLARSLNYEERSEYYLTAVVSDNSYAPRSASATVTVHVLNVEEAPRWPLPLSTVYITQSSICKNQQQQLQAFSQEVTTVSSNGDDAVEYYLMNTTKELSINKTSGLLKINGTLNEGHYAVLLRACNRNSSVCSDAVLTVVVQNKKTLAFCPTFYTVDVNETALVNFSFLQLNTTESGTVVSYHISAGNTEGTFGIGEHDGMLYVAEELDREKTQIYTLLISAEDLSSHELAEAQVIIRILDVANEIPQFSTSTYHGQVSESQATGSPVLLPLTNIPLVLTATDKDENSHLTYSIDPVNDTSNGSFNITADGKITLAKSVDYEKIHANLNKTYTFAVEATDGLYTSTATVVVHVQDVNDNPPRFVDPADMTVNITEGFTSGQDLIVVTATDPDTHTALVYSMSVVYPTGPSQVFYIDGSSGKIKILQDLDREKEDEYILNVTVTDGKFTIFKTVTVNVIDTNDNYPLFNQTFNMTVTEDHGTNIIVSTPYIITGQTKYLLVNCSFSHAPSDIVHLSSLALSRTTEGLDSPFHDLVSADAFTPDNITVEEDQSLAHVDHRISDDVFQTSFVAILWSYPYLPSTGFKCEANTLNRHGHSKTFSSEAKVINVGQKPTVFALLKELQIQGMENHQLQTENVQMKKENLIFRNLFISSDLFQGKRYYFPKNGHCQKFTADESRSMCESIGGNLAEIDDWFQYNFITKFLADKLDNEARATISGHQTGSGQWLFYGSQRPVTFLDWLGPSPEDSNVEDKRCLALGWSGNEIKMMANSCDGNVGSHNAAYLCERSDS